MFCPKCGKMNPDDGEKCTGCGAVLHEEKPKEEKKKPSGTRIIAAVAAVAVAIGAVAAAAVSCSKEPSVAFAEACYVTVVR